MFFLHILCCRIRFWPLLVSFILYFNDFLFIIWSNGQIISCRPLLYQTKIQLRHLIILQALRTCVSSPWLRAISSIVTGRNFLNIIWNIYHIEIYIEIQRLPFCVYQLISREDNRVFTNKSSTTCSIYN